MVYLFNLSVFLAIPIAQLGATQTDRSQTASTTKLDQAAVMSTTQFKVPSGTIAVYLPADVRAGDTISGTVISEPKGETEGSRKASGDVLNGYVVELAGQPAKAISGRFSAHIPLLAGARARALVLKDSSGQVVATQALPTMSVPSIAGMQTTVQPAPAGSPIPMPNPASNVPGPQGFCSLNVGQPGQPLAISGPFDGELATTSASFKNQPVQTLAENPRSTIVVNPSESAGPQSLEISENEITASVPFHNVTVKLSSPKTTLLKGESTRVKATIACLKDLPTTAYPITCTLTNLSPSIVKMHGGNVVIHKIDPPSDADDNVFIKDYKLTAMKGGAYSVKVMIETVCLPLSHIAMHDQDRPIDMNGIDTVGGLENYSIRRLMDTLRDLRRRQKDDMAAGGTSWDWFENRINLVKSALKQRGIDAR